VSDRHSRARLLVIPAAIAIALAGCATGNATLNPSGSPSGSPSESASASPSPSATDASPTPAATVGPQLSASDIENIQESISSGNTAALEGYLTNPIHIAFAASDLNDTVTPVQAIGDLDFLADATGWSWSVDATTLASWRASANYGTWFPDGAIIGHAASGQVISFVVAGTVVTAIYVAASTDLLTG
jgi:hypothetical protein